MRTTLLAATLLIGCPAISSADIAPWQLLESDFFRWSDWRENLSLYDCTNKMWYYMDNAPPAITSPAPPVYEPLVGFYDLSPPACCQDFVLPLPLPLPPMSEVPEPATWVMVLFGFVGMSFARWRRA